SRRRHTRFSRDWSSDVCSSDLSFCEFRALMPHERRIGQNTKDALQLIGISVSLASPKVKQGIFVDSCEIFCRKIGQLIHCVSVSPGRQYRAKTHPFPRFVLRLPQQFSAPPLFSPGARATSRLNARLHWLSHSAQT